MTKSEGYSVVFIIFIVLLVIIGAIVDTTMENDRNAQNHGTTRIATPTYYVDPRTEKCFAMFVNGSTASVECDDLVKSLMANDWINKED